MARLCFESNENRAKEPLKWPAHRADRYSTYGHGYESFLLPIFKELTFTQTLSSPLQRALETAKLAGFGERIETVRELMEWDYGDYEGITTK